MFAMRIEENAGKSMSAVGMAVRDRRQEKEAATILVGGRRGVEKYSARVRWRILATGPRGTCRRPLPFLRQLLITTRPPRDRRRRSRPQMPDPRQPPPAYGKELFH